MIAFENLFREQHGKQLEYIQWCSFQQQKQIQIVEEQKQRQLENDIRQWDNFKLALLSLTSQFPGLEARVSTGKILHLPNTQQKFFFQQLYSLYFSMVDCEISLIFIQKLIEIIRKFDLKEGENDFLQLQAHCVRKIHELQSFLESLTTADASKSHQTLLSFSNDPLLRRLSSSDEKTRRLLEQVKTLLNQKHAPPPQSTSQSSQPLFAESTTSFPVCIVSAKERIQWLAELADLAQPVAMPSEVADLLMEAIHALQLTNLRDEHGLENALTLGVNLLQRAATTVDGQPDPKILLKSILNLFEDGLIGAASAAELDAEEDWLLLSTAGW